jgi:hypothetical protein
MTVGRVIAGRYRILARLAEGELGEVYETHDKRLDRTVALQLFRGEVIGDPAGAERMFEKARAGSRLLQEYTARVVDGGVTAENEPFLVLESVRGTSLRLLLARDEQMEPELVLDVVAQCALALDAARRAGVAHGQLRPDDVFVDRHGSSAAVQVLGFGIDLPRDEDEDLLTAGVVSGTPVYLSPEALAGATTDERSDVYALGLMAYQMLAGRPPFEGETMAEILTKQLTAEPPPLPPSVPRPVRALVMQALEKQPSRRFESGEELAAACRDINSRAAARSFELGDWDEEQARAEGTRSGGRSPGIEAAPRAARGTPVEPLHIRATGPRSAIEPGPGRIEDALRRTYAHRPIWGDDDLFLDSGLDVAGDPDLVHWNTRFPDDPLVDETGALEAGRIYTLETGLAATADPLAAAAAALSAAMLAGASVRFAIRGRGVGVRRAGEDGPFTGSCDSGDVPFDRERRATAPVRFELCADASHPARVELSLYSQNALLLRMPIALSIAPPGAAASASLPLPPPRAIRHLMPARPAQVRIEITEDGELQVEIDPARERPRHPHQPLPDLADTAIRLRAALVALSESYRPDPANPPFGIQEDGRILLEFARIGAEMHEGFFGLPGDRAVDADLKRLAESLAAQQERGGIQPRLQIAAEHLPFPWAVVYDGAYAGKRLDRPEDVDVRCFWGVRFQIDRVVRANLDGLQSPVLPPPVEVRTCINPGLDAEQSLDVVRHQRGQFAGLRGVAPLACIESRDEFEAYLADSGAPPCDLLYFFCHARAAETVNAMFFRPTAPPQVQASIVLDDQGEIDVKSMRALRLDPLPGRPLVFMNACSSAAGDQAFQSVFLSHFVDTWRARGFVGTDWKVPTVFADAFGRLTLRYFLDEGMAIGDAFARAAAAAFAQGNPFPLVYALYVRPDLMVGPHRGAPGRSGITLSDESSPGGPS